MKEERSITENSILNAAMDEFLNKGFSGARTVAIAEKAGVNHAMLHYYFRTKESLFERVIERVANQFLDSLTKALDSQDYNGNFVDKIVMIMNVHFDFVITEPRLPLFMFREILPYPSRLEQLKIKVLSGISYLASQLLHEFDRAKNNKEVDEIDFLSLIFDILSLNISLAISSQFAPDLLGLRKEEYYAMRKKENEILLRKRLQING